MSLGQLAPLAPDRRRELLSEAARALRPGGVLILVERAAAGPRAPASPLRGLITAGAPGGGAVLSLEDIDGMRGRPGGGAAVWGDVQYDLALEGQDPHVLAVAQRGEGAARGGAAARAVAKEERKSERKRKQSSAKGF